MSELGIYLYSRLHTHTLNGREIWRSRFFQYVDSESGSKVVAPWNVSSNMITRSISLLRALPRQRLVCRLVVTENNMRTHQNTSQQTRLKMTLELSQRFARGTLGVHFLGSTPFYPHHFIPLHFLFHQDYSFYQRHAYTHYTRNEMEQSSERNQRFRHFSIIVICYS